MTAIGIVNSLIFKDISKIVISGKETKQTLSHVSGEVLPGELLAVMGASGSGKTTLLSILGGRALKNTAGEVHLGGILLNRKNMRRKVAFVLQEDIFLFSYTLTVRDHLMFAASMRLPEILTREEKRSRVEKVIIDLGLYYCADTPLYYVSGGERKRTSIGVELLCDPLMLLIDEGTSGLDSASVTTLMATIQYLATSSSMPVVTTIHQPSTAVFYSFDKLLLLSGGNMVYFGSPRLCMSYLSQQGFVPIHANVNPGDFALDLLSQYHYYEGYTQTILRDFDPNCTKKPSEILMENWSENQKVVEKPTGEAFKAALAKNIEELKFEATDIGQTSPPCKISSQELDSFDIQEMEQPQSNFKSYPSSYITQFVGLYLRAMCSRSDSFYSFDYLHIAETLIVALLAGLVWLQTPSDEEHLSDIKGFFFYSIVYWFFSGLFQGVLTFLSERHCLRKERDAGMYRLSAYFMAKTCISAPTRILSPIVYALIAYPMAIENAAPAALFGFGGILILLSLLGESVGLLVGTLTIQEDVAISAATFVALGMILMGGFYVEISHIPVYLRWLRFTSTLLYSYRSCLQIEVIYGNPIICNGGISVYACYGSEVLSQKDLLDWLGFTSGISLTTDIVILVSMFFILRLAAYFALRFMPHNSART